MKHLLLFSLGVGSAYLERKGRANSKVHIAKLLNRKLTPKINKKERKLKEIDSFHIYRNIHKYLNNEQK